MGAGSLHIYDRQQKLVQGIKPGKSGPRPSASDAELLDLIRRDLAASPFRGEGHRKVWGRLHFGQKLRVSRKRVLRLMRENQLLSPYRGRQGEPRAHNGTIITEALNLMWGPDGSVLQQRRRQIRSEVREAA